MKQFMGDPVEGTGVWRLLASPPIWEASRIGLDLTFGLYRHRLDVLRRWGLVQQGLSVLDIGCGIGQYSGITDGRYMGVDMSSQYIDYAQKRAKSNQTFRCADVTTLLGEDARYDVVLMVDFLHHISDEGCVELLRTAGTLATRYVVSFEPVTFQPHPVGKWIVEHDRGTHVRSLERLHGLFEEAGLHLDESEQLRLGPITTRAILARPHPSALEVSS